MTENLVFFDDPALTVIPNFLRRGHPDCDVTLAGWARARKARLKREQAARGKKAKREEAERMERERIAREEAERVQREAKWVERAGAEKDGPAVPARIPARSKRASKPRGETKPRVLGYKGHLAGSRKARVHECFDINGAAAAIKLGKKLELKEGTLRSWIVGWEKQKKA